MSINAYMTSKVQRKRNKNGTKYESYIIEKYGLTPANRDYPEIDLDIGKEYHVDAFWKDMMIEITTSVKDGKEAKIRLEARVFKKAFPNKKFVVYMKKIANPRLDGYDSFYDHLVLDPNIDKVLVGEEELKEHLEKPNYKKLTINNNQLNQGDNDMINIVVDRCIDKDNPQFLVEFMRHAGNMGLNMTKGKTNSDGLTPHQRKLQICDEVLESIKIKNPKVLSDDQLSSKIQLKRYLELWGYTTDGSSTNVFSGRVGKLLTNGVNLYTNTENLQYDKRASILNGLWLDKDIPSPKEV